MQAKSFSFPLHGAKRPFVKRVTNLKMSCINNASEQPKDKILRPKNNYEDAATALLNGIIWCFLAKSENSFIEVWRVGKLIL